MNEYLQQIQTAVVESLGPEMLADGLVAWTANLLRAFLSLAVCLLVWRGMRTVLTHALQRLAVDQTATQFLLTVARAVVLTLGTLVALAELGIDTTSLVASIGVAGLAVGFAAKDALANSIAGAFLFLDRPFVLGDLIEIKGQYGQVDRITLRSTRVVTVDGKMLAIPNAEVANSIVASYTNFPSLRIDVPVTVGVEEDLGRVRKLLIGIVRNDPDFKMKPPPEMVVSELNDYNVLVLLRVWLHDERKHVAKRFELRERVFETLRESGVDMPFETVKTHVVNAKE